MNERSHITPLVTILVPCYNQAQYVVEALDSVKAQTHGNIQVVICDDASSDESVQTISEYLLTNELNWLFLRNDENLGVTKTLNKMLEHATGDFICILAADDILNPEKVTRQLSEIGDHGVIYSDAEFITEAGATIGSFISRLRTNVPEECVFLELACGNWIPANSALIKREVFETIGTFDERLVYEDWDFWLRASLHYTFKYSNYVSCKVRCVEDSLMNRTNKSGEANHSNYLIGLKLLSSGKLDERLQTHYTNACMQYMLGSNS
jgi:glycosyltransferase involved in cell wall biosynthesis